MPKYDAAWLLGWNILLRSKFDPVFFAPFATTVAENSPTICLFARLDEVIDRN